MTTQETRKYLRKAGLLQNTWGSDTFWFHPVRGIQITETEHGIIGELPTWDATEMAQMRLETNQWMASPKMITISEGAMAPKLRTYANYTDYQNGEPFTEVEVTAEQLWEMRAKDAKGY